MKLSEMKPVQQGAIRKISATGPLRRRLMDMGLTIGAQITVVRTAPLGDPVEYSVRGYDLSLRKLEADLIEVDVEG
ncbi:MAG TPA: ferrous iron transport protein A [Bellilinea sp.]|jgi:ferrous iron transport protein A|nr:ferrous iron transport protein A [Bellilinea sp.]